jgi:hypothetical protein
LASEEARKKRTFFPEDVIDSNFHTSLLSGYPLSPWERVRVREKQKILHPLRDEGHLALRGTTRIV